MLSCKHYWLVESSISRYDPAEVSRLTELRKQLPMLIFIFKLSIILLINLLIKLNKNLKQVFQNINQSFVSTPYTIYLSPSISLHIHLS